MTEKGFIKIDRNILNWRWYHDLNTFKVFIHLLFKANYKDSEFKKHTIKRGQLVTGRKALSKELEMSEQSIRTALEHLKSTNEITITPTSKYSIITINSYNKYQDVNQHINQRLTSNQPTTNQQVTNNQPQYKKNKKNKKERMQEYNSACAQDENDDYIHPLDRMSLFKD